MSAARIAVARSRYLADRSGAYPVRPTVLASWRRSLDHRVCPERLDVPFVEGGEVGTPLMHAATPVLEALHEQLADESVSTLLTDARGVILARHVAHHGLASRLDTAKLTPGHVFAEEFAGTNGIGTALAGAGPVTIDGPEHFVGELTGFRCTAVPILHPTRRVVVGAFNLTAAADADSRMLASALAASTAAHIERELALISSRREYLLFERYLDACRAHRHTPVLAFNADVVMMNDRLRAAIAGADQTALLDHAREPGGRRARTLTLPSGLVVELRPGAPAGASDESGQVISVRLVGRPDRARRHVPGRQVPGLVGSDPAWCAALAEIDAAYATRSWTCVFGEVGTGKAHVVAALHRSRGGGPCTVLEPPLDDGPQSEQVLLDTLRRALRGRDELVVLRNTQWMGARLRTRVVDQLGELDPATTGRLVLTAQPSAVAPEDELVAACPTHVHVPPLRHRYADVLALARHFLRRYRPAGDRTFSPSAEHALQRCPWPENVRQLEQVVRRISRGPGAGPIEAADLPPECRVAGNVVLTQLQEVERDAILRGLIGHRRNVVRAARDLGISRATLYRRMRQYGIDLASL